MWTGAWHPDNRTFATGSRDKTVKVWLADTANKGTLTLLYTLPAFDSPVTSLDFHPTVASGFLAVGLESGSLLFYKAGPEKADLAKTIDDRLSHDAAVLRVKWGPGKPKEGAALLATVSEDTTFGVWQVNVE